MLFNFTFYGNILLQKLINYTNSLKNIFNKFFLKKNFFQYIKKFRLKNKILKKKKLLFKYFLKNKIIRYLYQLAFRINNFFFKYTNTNFFLSFYKQYKIVNFFFKKKINFKYLSNSINTFNRFNSIFINFIFFNNIVRLFFFTKNIFFSNTINCLINTLKYKVVFFISAGFGGYKKKIRRSSYRTKKMLELFKIKYLPHYFKSKMDCFYLIINGISTNFFKYFKDIRTLYISRYRNVDYFYMVVLYSYRLLKKFIKNVFKKQNIRYRFQKSIPYKICNLIKIYKLFKNKYQTSFKSKVIFFNSLFFFFFNSIIFNKQLYKSFFFEIIFLFLFKLFFFNKTILNIYYFISNNNFWELFYTKKKIKLKKKIKYFFFKKKYKFNINIFKDLKKNVLFNSSIKTINKVKKIDKLQKIDYDLYTKLSKISNETENKNETQSVIHNETEHKSLNKNIISFNTKNNINKLKVNKKNINLNNNYSSSYLKNNNKKNNNKKNNFKNINKKKITISNNNLSVNKKKNINILKYSLYKKKLTTFNKIDLTSLNLNKKQINKKKINKKKISQNNITKLFKLDHKKSKWHNKKLVTEKKLNFNLSLKKKMMKSFFFHYNKGNLFKTLLKKYLKTKFMYNYYTKKLPILISIVDKTSYPFNGCKRTKRY